MIWIPGTLRLDPSKLLAAAPPPEMVIGPKVATALPATAALADFLSESDHEPLITTSFTAMKESGSNGIMPGLLSAWPVEIEPLSIPPSDQPGKWKSVWSIQGR